MRTILCAMLAIVALAGFSNSSNAGPVTAYYNQAAWEAAVAGLAVGSYSGGGSTTFTNTTISIAPTPDCPGPFGFCIINVQTTTFPGVFNSVSAVMDFPNLTCFDCTRTTRIDIALDSPVLGFAATDNSFNAGILKVNGFGLQDFDAPNPKFFGLVGDISSLSFASGSCCTDSPARLNMSGFRFATAVPEPFTISLLALGCSGLSQCAAARKQGDC
jgi:hypothetical protein